MYDFDKHHSFFSSFGDLSDHFLWSSIPAIALLKYGDIHVCGQWFQKLCTIFEKIDPRDMLADSDPFSYNLVTGATHSVYHEPLGNLVRRFSKAMHLTFDEAEEYSQIYQRIITIQWGWKTDTHSYAHPTTLVTQLKRRHWLLAPEETSEDRIVEWLTGVPAECGSAGQLDVIDITPITPGLTSGGDCALVFESLGRLDEALVAAQTDIRLWVFHAPLRVQSLTTMARCQARLGRLGEAQASFEAAVAEAVRCELPWFELLARRDFIRHVLDAQGKRDEQMLGLGRCIDRMALEPADYDAVLGTGLNAATAMAELARQK